MARFPCDSTIFLFNVRRVNVSSTNQSPSFVCCWLYCSTDVREIIIITLWMHVELERRLTLEDLSVKDANKRLSVLRLLTYRVLIGWLLLFSLAITLFWFPVFLQSETRYSQQLYTTCCYVAWLASFCVAPIRDQISLCNVRVLTQQCEVVLMLFFLKLSISLLVQKVKGQRSRLLGYTKLRYKKVRFG